MQRVTSALCDFDVEIVLVLRRQDEFVHSPYIENIMKATPISFLSFPQFREEFEQRSLRFEDNLNVFLEVFGRMHVMLYDELRSDGRLCANFMRRISFDVDDLPEPGMVRESLTVGQARLKRALLPLVISRRVNNGINTLVRSSMLARMTERLESDSATGFWKSVRARRKWQQRYDAENERIRERFFPGRAELFASERKATVA